VSRPCSYLIINDLHIPFHRKKLVTKVCKLIYDIRPDNLVIAGDFGDYYSVSRHNAGSLGKLSGITLGSEYAQQNRVLDDLQSVLKRGCGKFMLAGNHEDSAYRWLAHEDNAKVAGAFRVPEEALRLRERGYHYQSNWKEASVDIGPLQIVHGEYCSQHCAHKHLLEYEGSVMHGHTHRTQSYVTGKRGAWSIGGLGDWHHEAFGYATASQRRRWTNAFALVHKFEDNSFLPNVIPVWNDRFVWAGKLY
jgi:UDP-2,3-diacylglucosamine pyrophosphatase LpxH